MYPGFDYVDATLPFYAKRLQFQETYGLLNELYSAEPASLLSSIRGGLEDAAVIRVHSDTTRKGSEENVKKTEKLVQGMYTVSYRELIFNTIAV